MRKLQHGRHKVQALRLRGFEAHNGAGDAPLQMYHTSRFEKVGPTVNTAENRGQMTCKAHFAERLTAQRE